MAQAGPRGLGAGPAAQPGLNHSPEQPLRVGNRGNCGPGGGLTGYSDKWGRVDGEGSTSSPCPTLFLSQEPHLAGLPLAPRSGGHWEAPTGAGAQRERSGTHPCSLLHTPLAVMSPPRLLLPFVSAVPLVPAGSPSPDPPSPPVFCLPRRGSASCSC